MAETTTKRVTILGADGAVLAQYVLGEGEHSVGRDAACAVRIDNGFISRQHATLTLRGDTVAIEDLGSTAGTFLDGAPIRGRVEVLPTQTVKLHDLTLRIEGGEPDKVEPGGKLAGGRFSLIRKVGQGGMGMVWLARDEQLEEPVALKMLAEDLANNAGAMDDLKRETQKSRRLSHPNIIRIHDLVQTGTAPPFIVMEFVDGSELEHMRLRQPQRFFEWREIEDLILQLCEALEYAHGQMIVHRDLKPANIIVTGERRVKLADFGVSATISGVTRRVNNPREIAGTPMFMSPQQLRGQDPEVTDDLYALGAMLFELLTSRPPFYDGDIFHQVLNETPPTIHEQLTKFAMRNPVPDHINQLVDACLAKDPAQRPANAREVADRIRRQGSATATVTPALEEDAMDPLQEIPTEPIAPAELKGPEPQAESPLQDSEDLPLRPTTRVFDESPEGEGSKRNLLLVVGVAVGVLAAVAVWMALKPDAENSVPAPSSPSNVAVTPTTNSALSPATNTPAPPATNTPPPSLPKTPSGPLLKALENASGNLTIALQALVGETRITLNATNAIERLNLQGHELSVAGFARLGTLTNLVNLNLLETGVADADLKLLSGMSRLEKLNLAQTQVTAAGLTNLDGLTNLVSLNLAQTQVDTPSLIILRRMPRLESLNLASAKVDDTLFAHLPLPSPMRTLYLDGTAITDVGLPALSRLTRLEELHLEDTAITDMGLAYLRPLKQLSFLYLRGAKTTLGGVAQLRPFLPQCTVLLE